jgi:hypothetical protein
MEMDKRDGGKNESFLRETLRFFNFLFCVLVTERSMKMILSSVYRRFYKEFLRETLRFFNFLFLLCVLVPERSIIIILSNDNRRFYEAFLKGALRLFNFLFLRFDFQNRHFPVCLLSVHIQTTNAGRHAEQVSKMNI